ncbi:MAG TPA: hypothetical protein VI299_03790, partial [Polyangiales bacterium]
MSALRTYLWTAWIALVGCGSPLVGLECQDGLSRCGGACYDLTSDELHCGGCGITCSADQHCAQSMCVAGPEPDAGDGGLDATPGDATMDGARTDAEPDGTVVVPDGAMVLPDGAVVLPDGAVLLPDGGILTDDGSVGDGGDGMVSMPPVLCTGVGSPADCVCGIGTTKCGLACVDLKADHDNCGMCGMMCAADQYCNQGMCDLICTPPVVLCNGQCVDFTSDDANCGSCGFACGPAAQCIDSDCVGQAIGHVVVIGHDMSGVLRPAIRQMVGNAVLQ